MSKSPAAEETDVKSSRQMPTYGTCMNGAEIKTKQEPRNVISRHSDGDLFSLPQGGIYYNETIGTDAVDTSNG